MNNIKNFVRKHKSIKRMVWPIYKLIQDIRLYICTRKKITNACKKEKRIIFYIGVPAHTNLGDLAQYVCIKEWLEKYYNDYTIVEIETNSLVNTRFSVIKVLKKYYNKNCFFVFQSGYTTTDLGGYADEMHKFIIKEFKDAKMLMMPQTIFFKNDYRRRDTSKVYDSAINMLYLARDKISYKEAIKMFPHIKVLLYPDIVTTLIGKYNYNNSNDREGILFCCRDDEEKFYTDDEIKELLDKLKKKYKVDMVDTTKKNNEKLILKNPKEYILREIENYSKYKLIITDRYHGTIFSLISNTPVIIMKTTDHKVTTGAMWFKGIYDDYAYLSKNLEDVEKNIDKLISSNKSMIKPFFDEKYYSKLSELFDEYVKR